MEAGTDGRAPPGSTLTPLFPDWGPAALSNFKKYRAKNTSPSQRRSKVSTNINKTGDVLLRGRQRAFPGETQEFQHLNGEGVVFKGKMFPGSLVAPLQLESFNHPLITWRAEPRERGEGGNWGGGAEQNSWGEICHAPLGAARCKNLPLFAAKGTNSRWIPKEPWVSQSLFNPSLDLRFSMPTFPPRHTGFE